MLKRARGDKVIYRMYRYISLSPLNGLVSPEARGWSRGAACLSARAGPPLLSRSPLTPATSLCRLATRDGTLWRRNPDADGPAAVRCRSGLSGLEGFPSSGQARTPGPLCRRAGEGVCTVSALFSMHSTDTDQGTPGHSASASSRGRLPRCVQRSEI